MPAKKAAEPESTDTKRILLVDDDAEIIESLKAALESRGYETLIARDGNQGLAMAEREDPDLVILDMMMPKRSGFLVLEKLRRTRPVPMRVIMITANEGSRHKAYAEMLGVDDYIRKPFAMDRLLDSVDRLLGVDRISRLQDSHIVESCWRVASHLRSIIGRRHLVAISCPYKRYPFVNFRPSSLVQRILPARAF